MKSVFWIRINFFSPNERQRIDWIIILLNRWTIYWMLSFRQKAHYLQWGLSVSFVFVVVNSLFSGCCHSYSIEIFQKHVLTGRAWMTLFGAWLLPARKIYIIIIVREERILDTQNSTYALRNIKKKIMIQKSGKSPSGEKDLGTVLCFSPHWSKIIYFGYLESFSRFWAD